MPKTPLKVRSKAPVGFIGLGLMGTPMVERLSTSGHSLSVWNRSPSKYPSLTHTSAHFCESLKELAEASQIIMLCVSDTDAVRNVIFGAPMRPGLAHYLNREHVIVDFSSIEPDTTRDMAKELNTRFGARWVDAPVSGGVSGAEKGTLSIMAGGDAELIDELRPLLSSLSDRVTRMGGVGSGQATKVCNQMIVSANLMVMAEALALAEKSGVNAQLIPEALKGGFADSLPLQITGTRMVERDFSDIKWTLKTLHKDLSMAAQLAKHHGGDTPMTELAKSLMERYNMMDLDPANLIQVYED